MTPMPLGLFVKKLQPKVGLGRYDILFAYFVVEAKSKMIFFEKKKLKKNSEKIILKKKYLLFFLKTYKTRF